MAFSPEQILAIGNATGVSPSTVAVRLTLYASSITAEVETLVGDLLDEYEAAEAAVAQGVSVEPKESNFGARVDPSIALRLARQKIANQLFLTDLVGVSGQTAMLRG